MCLTVHEIEIVKVLINISIVTHRLKIEVLFLRSPLQREGPLVWEALSEVLLNNIDLQLLQQRALVTQEVALLLRGEMELPQDLGPKDELVMNRRSIYPGESPYNQRCILAVKLRELVF